MDSNVAQQWADQARYDLQTARAMWESGRYVYVLFCCQQAIEKALKAIIIEHSGELPPRTHNLPRLAKVAQIEPDEQQLEFFAELSIDYMRTRYPDQMHKLSRVATRQSTASVLRTTEEMTEWLLSMLT